MVYVGVDTGGTFTDFAILDPADGSIRTLKVRSVPSDPGRAVEAGLAEMQARFGIPPAAVERFVFGTTVATNAVLERKGAATALIATMGTRDVLEIQRQWRHRLFDLSLQRPPPLVPRRLRFDVTERLAADGSVLQALDTASLEPALAAMRAAGVESLAVCFLFSFLDPAHERAAAAWLAERLPGLHVSLSSEICPEFREYERTATTAMNAYVMPKIDRLLARLRSCLADAGCRTELRIIQSNGGLMDVGQARRFPVRTLLSGPAGGVVGALAVAKAAGIGSILTMDMGGTSVDICLVQDGRVKLSPEGGIGGFPVKVPQIDIHTIGAGGGSIARLGRGTLKVGPDSAGADPGPVCYGQGGTEPTSTDAALVLGYIDPDYFLGGDIRLDLAAARRVVGEKIGRPLGLDAEGAAGAIVRVQVANMVSGIRSASVEKGLDPREFALLPFGGAGALYAGLVAEELGMRRIIVPVHPSVLSALGMLMTDVKYARSTTRLAAADDCEGPELAAAFAVLEEGVRQDLAAERLPPERLLLERSIDMRYRGQAYEINLGVAGGAIDRAAIAAIVADFHREHRALYGYAAESEPVEFVNLRVTGTGVVVKAALAPLAPGAAPAAAKSRRTAHFPAGPADTPVYDRAALAPGQRLAGPAIVDEAGASIVVYPGHVLTVDTIGNLIIDLPAA